MINKLFAILLFGTNIIMTIASIIAIVLSLLAKRKGNKTAAKYSFASTFGFSLGLLGCVIATGLLI